MGYELTIIEGNVGREPQMRYMPDGRAVTNFSVAVNTRKDGAPNWYNVSAWDRQAEICNEYVKKGMSVLIQGRVKARSWVDGNGKAMASLELSADRVQFIGGRNGESAVPSAPDDMELDPPTDVDDIPF